MNADVKDINEAAWDNGEFGHSAEHAVAASANLDAEIDDALGLQMISIRLPKKLIDDLKLIAKKEGLGYQPLIRKVLIRFAHAEFRSMARDRLVSEINNCEADPIDDLIAAAG